MRLKNRIKSALKNTSGASLLFVLGIMMFLMSIGVSTLAAAAANSSYILRQRDYNRVLMLGESVHESIMYSLQENPGDKDSLGHSLAMAVFLANDEYNTMSLHYQPTGLAPIPFTLTVDGVDINNSTNVAFVERITLSFPDQLVSHKLPIPAVIPVYEEIGGVDVLVNYPHEREPRLATVNARMIVEVVINSRGRHITSRSIYEYTGGRLTDFITGDAGAIPPGNQWDVTTPPDGQYSKYPMYFTADGYGTWRLVNHEILDN